MSLQYYFILGMLIMLTLKVIECFPTIMKDLLFNLEKGLCWGERSLLGNVYPSQWFSDLQAVLIFRNY